ncbi:hypothetical protein ABT364_03380 [Massilia sp. SR12]
MPLFARALTRIRKWLGIRGKFTRSVQHLIRADALTRPAQLNVSLRMTQKFRQMYVGVEPADAENIELSYVRGNLMLRYVDWREAHRSAEFIDVLAFRWQEYDDLNTPRDDSTYCIENSAWLEEQTPLSQFRDTYAHYKICFNACGVLDVLCQKLPD